MVDTSKRSDAAAAPSKAKPKATAAPTKPKSAAELDACFWTMTLEDPTSVRRPRPRPQPKPEPLQAPMPPTSRADALQQFEMVRQHWPQPPSQAAKYASLLGSRSPSSFLASHFGACSPRFNALAATFSPSTPSSSTNQPAWDHYLGGLNPFASAPMSVGLSHNAASLINHHPYAGSASTHQPHAAVPAAASFAQHDNAVPYASAFLMSQLHANNSQVDCYHQPMAPAVPRVPTLAEVRSRLLRGPMDPALVATSPQTAAHVVRLLQEGGEEARRSVLAGVVGAVHGVMDSREARDVFRALLGACAVRVDELRRIVHAVCAGRDVLMGILKHDHGVKSLKALIVAVAPYHQLSESLIIWLLKERLTEHCKCGELLNHCFACIPYETCSVMIQFAIRNIDAMLSSASGSIYLAECFANAMNVELHFLEDILLRNTSRIATGQYSNYFMQRVLECGSEGLKERIAERVAADVANLSVDKFGSYVVEACFLQTFSLAPMRRVLVALLNLPGEQLGELVRGGYSNYVVHKLLAAGKRPFPAETTALARRIEKLPAAVQREMHAQRVMRVVKKHFPRKPHY